MGFFGSSKPKFKQLPDAASATAWRNQFIKSWSSNPPEYPTEEVLGLTDAEQQNIAQLRDYLNGGTGGWNLAMNQVTDVLNSPDSGIDNPGYRGFLGEQERLRGQSVKSARNRARLGGSLDRSSAILSENNVNKSYDDTEAQRLWAIEQDIKDRKERAGITAANLGSERMRDLLAGDALLTKERMVEQAKRTAIYQQQLQQFLLPFTLMANVASQAVSQGTISYMDYKPGVYDYLKAGGDVMAGLASFGSAMPFPNQALSAGVSPQGTATATGRTSSGGFTFG